MHLVAAHEFDGVLHQQKGRPRIDGKDPIEKFGACIDDRAAARVARGVHKSVDAPEGPVRLSHDSSAILDLCEVSAHEYDRCACGCGNRVGLWSPLCLVATARYDALGTALGEEFRNGSTEALCTSSDNRDLAMH
jgi:hypothetical protein